MAMHFYRDIIYPFLVDAWGDPPPIRKIRQQIISLAHGIVLEIGVGSGANFPHYDPMKVSKLYALEPNSGMIQLARQQEGRTKLNVEYIGLPGEHIPLADETIDSVVSTFTLCTVPGIMEAIQGIARVLKPAGELIFLELGLAPDPIVQRRQKTIGAILSLVISGSISNTRYSLLAPSGWISVQAHGNGISSTVSKVVDLLLVGYSDQTLNKRSSKLWTEW